MNPPRRRRARSSLIRPSRMVTQWTSWPTCASNLNWHTDKGGMVMLRHKSFLLAIVLSGAFAGASWGQTQTANQAQPPAGGSTGAPVTTVDQAVDRIIAREHDEIAAIRR